MGKLMQYVGTLIICNLCLCLGIMFSWPSSTLRLFESANTTLNRPMSQSELAMFGSLSSVGALISTPVVGLTMDHFGRKQSGIVSSLLAVIAWVMLAFSSQVEVVLASMFVCGLSGAVFLIVAVYVGEICEQSIRGAMCAGTILFYGLGMMLSYILGGYLQYKVSIYIYLTWTTIATLLLAVLKESPICLMIQGKQKEAAKSLAFYRQLNYDSKEIQEELNNMAQSLSPELDDATPEEKKQLKPEKKSKENMSLWKFIKKSRTTHSAIYMTLILVTASIFQGLVVIQVYTEPLFAEAVPSMSPNLCSILFSVVSILAGLVAGYLTEIVGRRPLMIYASFVTAASCLFLGIQLHLNVGPNWLIAVNIYFFTTVYSLGAGTVPFVLIAEVFLPEVKSFMSMLSIEWAWICNSVILFIFNPLLNTIGLGPLFYIFAAIGILTAIYSIFFVPETKGLSVDEIQEAFIKKNNDSLG